MIGQPGQGNPRQVADAVNVVAKGQTGCLGQKPRFKSPAVRDDRHVAGKGHEVFYRNADAGRVAYIFERNAGQARGFFGHAHARARLGMEPVDHFARFDFDAVDPDDFRFFGIQPRGFQGEGYERMENGHVGFGLTLWVLSGILTALTRQFGSRILIIQHNSRKAKP